MAASRERVCGGCPTGDALPLSMWQIVSEGNSFFFSIIFDFNLFFYFDFTSDFFSSQ